MSSKPYEKYIGKKFGNLTVIDFIPGNYKNGKSVRAKAECRCDCGFEKSIQWGHLKRGKIRSCGCLKIESLELKVKNLESRLKKFENKE